MTLQLISCGTYTQIHPKINLPVYLHASLSSNHKDLPVTTTTCLPAHRCTRSGPYLFMFMLLFQLTTKIYPSTFLHVHRCTCSSVYLFSIFLPFQQNMHSYLSAHLLWYVYTDLTENKSTFLSSCFSFV